ncbi:MAG: hypothetical protein O2779_01385 [Nanoarchaeota archaeon]|nr:hypothetical protein [Nanoarchaeota archaeon]
MPIEAIRKLTPLEEFTTVFQGYNRDVPSRKSIDAFDTKVSTFYEQLSKRVSEHSGTFQYEVNEKGAIVTDYSLNTDSLFRHVDFYLASIKQANHLARRPKEGIELNRLLRLIEHGEGVYSDKEHNQTRKLASWHGERLRRGLAWDEMNVADTQYTDNLNDVELAGQNASYFAGHFLAGRVYDAKIAHHKRKQHQEDHLGEVSREDMQAGYERLLLDYGPDIAEHYGGLAFAAGMGAGKLAGMVMGGLAIHNALTSSASVSSGIPTPPPKVAFPLPSPRF